MRQLANEGNFTQFSQGLPRNVSNADAKKVYNEVRRGMGLKEQKDYFNKLHFEPVSEKREAYVKGNLFNIGDSVTVVGSDELARVTSLGSNYVIIEQNGKFYRKWLDSVELLEKERKKDLHILKSTVSMMTIILQLINKLREIRQLRLSQVYIHLSTEECTEKTQ